jgi:hypothetical protein
MRKSEGNIKFRQLKKLSEEEATLRAMEDRQSVAIPIVEDVVKNQVQKPQGIRTRLDTAPGPRVTV